MVVLDTDHLTLLQWAECAAARRLRERLEQVPPEQWAATIITYEEQTRGWLAHVAHARTPVQMVDAYRKLNRHLNGFRPLRVLEFDERAAAEFQRLRQSRLRIGTKDIQIAAIVLAFGATLLSGNLGHFHKVPGLRVEDWTV
jgi:tRNA(fMet)-specific endonuclease VapC